MNGNELEEEQEQRIRSAVASPNCRIFLDWKEVRVFEAEQKKKEAARRVNDYEPNSDEESDDESDIFQNTNRPKVNLIEESTESSSSEDEQ